jgi:hypothetical protein
VITEAYEELKDTELKTSRTSDQLDDALGVGTRANSSPKGGAATAGQPATVAAQLQNIHALLNKHCNIVKKADQKY